TFSEEDTTVFSDLAGVSAEVVASCDGQRFCEKMLITHRGLSGPAILQISSYWKKPQTVSLDLAPGRDVTEPMMLGNSPRTATALRAELQKVLPTRLAACWLEARPITSWTNEALRDTEGRIHDWTITPAGTEGYGKAEVTVGGVDTDELSAKTME